MQKPKKTLLFLNPSLLADKYGEQYLPYFKVFSRKAHEFIEVQRLNPSEEESSINKTLLNENNITPTAFILAFMMGMEIKFMDRYLDLLFSSLESPLTASLRLISEFPTISPCLSGFTGGSANGEVPFISSDIITARYIINKPPCLSGFNLHEIEPCGIEKSILFSVNISPNKFSIVNITKVEPDSEISRVMDVIAPEIQGEIRTLIETVNITSSPDGVITSSLHFGTALNEKGDVIGPQPSSEQTKLAIKSAYLVGSGYVVPSGERGVLIEKLSRTKSNKKSIMKQLSLKQERFLIADTSNPAIRGIITTPK